MGQAPAGWYPVEDGRLRYWDGAIWTEHFAAGRATVEGTRDSNPITQRLRAVVATPVLEDPDAIWQGVGKPITGLGAGRYRLTRHYLFLEKGVVSTNGQQVPIAAVLDVDVKQSMAQKARGVGTLTVHIQRQRGIELVHLEDLDGFRDVQVLINETAHAARLDIQRHNNTHRHENTHLVARLDSVDRGADSTPKELATQAEEGAARPDPIEQLKELGSLREMGVLTQEEFAAKKAEILSRI